MFLYGLTEYNHKMNVSEPCTRVTSNISTFWSLQQAGNNSGISRRFRLTSGRVHVSVFPIRAIFNAVVLTRLLFNTAFGT